MLKKSTKIYPEEEIIDGFSILCFDNYKTLKKYTNSLNAVIRKVARKNFNACNKLQRNSSNCNSKTINSTKKLNFESMSLLKPTRITAKRKSKPDISVLSLSISKKKRFNGIPAVKNNSKINVPAITPIIIDVDKNTSVLTTLESDSKCNEIKVECLDMFTTFNKLTEVIGKCDPARSECSNHSLGENSNTTNSTSSPMSIQPVYYEIDSLELYLSDKVDIDKYNDDITIKDYTEEPHKNDHSDRVEIIEMELIDTVEDDCVILSVGFDPHPQLTNIPIINGQFVTENVPILHPAPRSALSAKEFVASNPPPLTPAPDTYFSSLTCDQVSLKLDLSSYKADKDSKVKSRKRGYTKSIAQKNVKHFQCPSPIKPNYRSQFPSNIDESLFKLYPIPISAITSVTASSTLSSTSISSRKISPTIISNKSMLSKPIPIYYSNKKPPMKISNGFSQCLIRKTVCHVHIAQFIHRQLIQDSCNSKSPINTALLIKPRPLRPIIQSPLNLSSQRNDRHLTNSHNKLQVPSKSMPRPSLSSLSPLNSVKSMKDIPIMIRPLSKTYHLVANTFTSRATNSIAIFPREKIPIMK